MPHVLITGTTSGIGLGLAEYYWMKGWRVTTVNRRATEPVPSGITNHVFDVRDADAVAKWVRNAADRKELPDLWLLTAGVNRADATEEFFSPLVFRAVLDTNLGGILNFLDSYAGQTTLKDTTFVCASSTSNIVGNPSTLGYNVSKAALHYLFQHLDRRYRAHGVRFKSLVLGPIATNIYVPSGRASGLQKRVRDWLTVDVDEAVPVIAKFLEGDRQALYYPRRAVWTMRALKVAMKVWPGVYKG